MFRVFRGLHRPVHLSGYAAPIRRVESTSIVPTHPHPLDLEHSRLDLPCLFTLYGKWGRDRAGTAGSPGHPECTAGEVKAAGGQLQLPLFFSPVGVQLKFGPVTPNPDVYNV